MCGAEAEVRNNIPSCIRPPTGWMVSIGRRIIATFPWRTQKSQEQHKQTNKQTETIETKRLWSFGTPQRPIRPSRQKYCDFTAKTNRRRSRFARQRFLSFSGDCSKRGRNSSIRARTEVSESTIVGLYRPTTMIRVDT